MKHCIWFLMILIGLRTGAAAQEHSHAAHELEALGTVNFPIGCAEPVRQPFLRAVALLHSFGYEEARRAFQQIAEQDPQCGMAQWGIAMSYYHPIWAPPTPAELAAGRAAAEAAQRLGAASERERGYIAAIAAFYRDSDNVDHRTRAQAFRAASEALMRRFPEDHEATIFYALALLGTAPPSDTTFAQQKQAAELLQRMLPLEPNHPGVAHYMIHSFDYPQLAELALDAARVYAKIAPDSAHALHMPSHIFTRLGLWSESISSNLDSARSARALVARRHPGAASFDALHAIDYLVYAHLQLSQDQQARAAIAEAEQARSFDDPNFAAAFALAAAPARYALERRQWAEAAALAPPAAELPWERYQYVLGETHFARALGAARSGDPARARQAIGELERIHAALTAQPPAGPYDWAGHVESLKLAAQAWLERAEGRNQEAVDLMTRAAELDEKVGKHPVTPGALLPPRELLGDLLLELGRPAEALRHYELALADAPNRFNGLYGAARAAETAGEPAKSRDYYAKLIELGSAADPARPELARAHAALRGS